MEPILLYWAVYRKLFPMVASDWLYYTARTIHLQKNVFDCSVMNPCFLSKCELDLQNAWILYFTVHLIHLCDEALLSISKCVHAYFCTFLHHYCTLLWYIISDKKSGAHKSPMVSCPIGIYRLMLFIRSLITEVNYLPLCYILYCFSSDVCICQ